MREEMLKDLILEVERIITVHDTDILEYLAVITEMLEKVEDLALDIVLYKDNYEILWQMGDVKGEKELRIRGIAFKEGKMTKIQKKGWQIFSLARDIKDVMDKIRELMEERERNLRDDWKVDLEFLIDKYLRKLKTEKGG